MAVLPSDSVQAMGDLTVEIGGSDQADSITGVQVFVDGKLRATGSSLPLRWLWPTRSEASGAHQLQARIIDSAGRPVSAGMTVATLRQ